jgi:hypothetical protein
LRDAYAAELQGMERKGWAMSEYSLMTSYWVRSPDDMRALLADPEWHEKVNEPEKDWIDTENIVILAGYETVYIEDEEIKIP